MRGKESGQQIAVTSEDLEAWQGSSATLHNPGPERKGDGVGRPQVGPPRLGPDSVYLGPPKSEKRKKKKKQNLV